MEPRARQDSTTTTPVESAERARAMALRILANAPRSSGQLRDALRKRHVIEPVIEEIVERYVEVGLLDDRTLAAAIARTRHAERGCSRRVIEVELRRKGFEQPDIDSALAQIDDEDEFERASELALKRWRKLDGLEPEVRVRRTVAMLGRKGYSPSLAFGVVKSLDNADSEETRSM
ncbi:regulatory protein RecX [Demequina aurantiaca]|uniref:regulatory protein RecX n=1 Tax=Demequina aurantiaca TaxID=676200 RepID=UPI003D34F652